MDFSGPPNQKILVLKDRNFCIVGPLKSTSFFCLTLHVIQWLVQLSEYDTNATWRQEAETSTIDSTHCRHFMQLHFYLGRIFSLQHRIYYVAIKPDLGTYLFLHTYQCICIGTVQAELLEYVAFKILKTFF